MNRIIGDSSSLSDTLNHVSIVAPLDRSVLVLGERGCGKELIAERLHYLSSRWDKAFDKVNCAAISEALLDSELFGHEAGAFTGATKQHVGRFERAAGGTLLLDELGTLPLRIQEKLLRVIEYGEFERVGGQKTLSVDVRIIGSTNQDLRRMTLENTFRHDLLDRLAFDVIQVPPLRERLEDIPALIDHFATRMCSELGRDYYSGFSKTSIKQFLQWPWPGNIRELKNAVERSVCHWQDVDEPIEKVIIDPFANVSLSQFQSIEESIEESLEQAEPSAEPVVTNALSFHEQVKSLEVALLKEGLARNQNNQRKTAQDIGMTYHQLRALLKKYKHELT